MDEWRKKLESEAVDFGGAKVYPIPSTNNVDRTATTPKLKNELNMYNNTGSGSYTRSAPAQPAANQGGYMQQGSLPNRATQSQTIENPMAPAPNTQNNAIGGLVDKNAARNVENNAAQSGATKVESRRFE